MSSFHRDSKRPLAATNADQSKQPAHGTAAHSLVVNRTHRIVREQALQMREQRRRSRGLMAPLFICSSLLLVICYALWRVMDGYDLTPNGIPDASDQVLLFLLWSLPVTVIVLGLVWFRRRTRNGEPLV